MIRRAIKEKCVFIIPSETEEIELEGLEENWSTEFDIKAHDGVVRNIDHKGMFVMAHKVPKLGEQVTIQLVLPGHEEKVQVRGTVVWINQWAKDIPSGFAVKYLDISVSIKILKECVERIMLADERFLNIPETVTM